MSLAETLNALSRPNNKTNQRSQLDSCKTQASNGIQKIHENSSINSVFP